MFSLSVPVVSRVFRSSRPDRFAGRLPMLCLPMLCVVALCLAPVTGCARSAASPVAATPAAALPADSGVLLAVFGTSEPEALAAYEAIAASYAKLGVPVVWAYTSDIIQIGRAHV